MADGAYLKTATWDDDWFAELDSDEQLLWLFLLTNSARNLAGVYRLPLKRILYYNQHFTKDSVLATLARFQVEEKIHYEHDWIVVRNHFKNQSLGGPKQWGAVSAAINAAPDWLRERLLTASDSLFMSIDTVSEGYLYTTATLSTKRREENTKYSTSLKRNADGKSAGRISTAETSLQKDIREARENSQALDEEV